MQSYQSHTHHPVPTYVAAVFAIAAFICAIGAWFFGWPTRDAALVSVVVAVMALVSISRAYTVRLQDRVIFLEMKVRAAELLAPELEARFAELTPKQVIALRFASDAEFGELAERAVRDRLSPDEIKRAIKTWRPDLLRT